MTRRLTGTLVARRLPIIGRDALVESLGQDLRTSRLVTLTGPGGVGKTRLALEVAARVADDFPHGVWLAELGAVEDPRAVSYAVAATLGIAPEGDTPMDERIADTVAGRGVLLVLDNCEHVLGAVERLVHLLLTTPGEARILATSRERLGVADQAEVPVQPLDLDADLSSPAVQLFVERARGVRPNFSIQDHPATGPAVLEICRTLDGLPFGIELAAARMAGMGVADVRDRLGSRFRLLEGDPAAPARHRSLPDLVQWSFDLLDADERGVLEQAAVFAGGFDLAAYVGVYGVTDDLTVLRALDRLVRSSLLVADHAEGRVRYRLLETTRQFALDVLAGAGRLEDCRDRHADHYASRVVTLWDAWNGPGWRPAVDWVSAELANLRSAYHWSSGRDLAVAADVAAHAALIGVSANLFEPISWAEALLETASHADLERLPRLYSAAGYACFVGRAPAAVVHVERALELEATGGYDPVQPGLTPFIGALANVYAGDLPRYLELASVAAEVPGSAEAFALSALADGLQSSARTDEALALLDRSVPAARKVGSPFWLAYALWIAGMTLSGSDPARALATWDEGVDLVEEHGVEFFRGFLARDSARLHTTQGNQETALPLFVSAIEVFLRAGNLAQLVVTLASVPELLDRLGRRQAAATLQAAMSAIPASVEHVPELATLGARLAAELGGSYAALAAAGSALDLDESASYALAQLHEAQQDRERTSPAWPPGGLTRRELDVLRLVTDGLTTRDIAQRLFISPKTADRHIQNIYTKIGASNRATAIRWAMDHGVATSPG